MIRDDSDSSDDEGPYVAEDSDDNGEDGSDIDDLDTLLQSFEKPGSSAAASRQSTLERGGAAVSSAAPLSRSGSDARSTVPGSAASSLVPSGSRLGNEEFGHTQAVELYVLVARCIAFPFSAQARSSMSRTRHLKLTENDLDQYCAQFEAFLTGKLTSITSDEAFDKAIVCYYDNFLITKRLLSLVRSGGCTFADLRKVFQNCVEKFLKSLPLMERVAHDRILTVWMSKYEAICRGNEDMETARRDSIAMMRERQTADDSVTPDHLYKVFQAILDIPQREHHLLAKELQLENADEQATVIRRELRHRLNYLTTCNVKEVAKKLVSREPNMAQAYLAEQHSHITKLRNTLNQMPISKKSDPNRRSKVPAGDDAALDPSTVIKSDITISTAVNLTLRKARGLDFLPPDKPVFCIMEMDGHSSRMATAQYPASRPIWDTFAPFATGTPLPCIRIKLMADSKGILDADGKQVAKLMLQPTLCQSDGDRWYKMTPTVSLPDKNQVIEVQAQVAMEKAVNVKFSGWLYCVGRDPWKKWKKHYFVLVQMTTFACALCTFREKQSVPSEVISLSGCTVDYCEEDARRGFGEEGYTQYQFHLLMAGNSIVFCSAARNQMEQWVYQLARATGQTHRPQAPTAGKTHTLSPKPQGKPTSNALYELNLDENFLTRDITSFDHAMLYSELLRQTLSYRLKDPASSMGWLTPGQQFLLDEYQARYCLRGFAAHFAMLKALLEHASNGTYIDSSLMQFSFTFCLAHIQGQKPDNYHSVTIDEKTAFMDMLESVHDLQRHQLERLTHSFPFCLPDGGLKSTLRLFARVISAQLGQTSALSSDPSKVTDQVCECLKKAAMQCFSDVAEDVTAQMAGSGSVDQVCNTTLEFLVNLSGECIEQMGQSQIYYAKAFGEYEGALEAFEEAFWSFYELDLETIVKTAPVESGKVFQVFEQINTYLLNHAKLRDQKFHTHLLSVFMPLVANYLDVMSVTMEKEIAVSVANETWRQDQNSAKCAEELFSKLQGLHRFAQRLAWPEPLFADHLEKRVQRAISDLLLSLCNRTHACFKQILDKQEPCQHALYIAPRQCWVMVDVVTASMDQASLLCSDPDEEDPSGTAAAAQVTAGYGGNTLVALETLQVQMISDMSEVLNFSVRDIISKLSLHDPTNLVFSLLNRMRTSAIDLEELSMSVDHNLQSIQECAAATPVMDIVTIWYDSLLSIIDEWLKKHPEQSLKFIQFDTLQGALEVIVHRFVVYFNTEQDARTPLLTSVEDRLRLEQSAYELASTS